MSCLEAGAGAAFRVAFPVLGAPAAADAVLKLNGHTRLLIEIARGGGGPGERQVLPTRLEPKMRLSTPSAQPDPLDSE